MSTPHAPAGDPDAIHEPYALVADPGIDDAVALAVLCGLGVPPSLVVAVPGNVDGAAAARHAVGLAALLGLAVVVRAHGATAPAYAMPGRRAPHGGDGLGGLAARLPPASAPPSLAPAEFPARVLATGPLRCVADAIDAGWQPDRIVWMGGGLQAGNVTAAAEFNAWCEPEAVNVVVAAHPDLGIVPLDVTAQVALQPHDLDRLASGRVGALLADALRSRSTAFVHDAVAAVAWLRPDLFGWQHLTLRCDTATATRGRLVSEGAGATPIATTIDADAVREHLIAGVIACG